MFSFTHPGVGAHGKSSRRSLSLCSAAGDYGRSGCAVRAGADHSFPFFIEIMENKCCLCPLQKEHRQTAYVCVWVCVCVNACLQWFSFSGGKKNLMHNSERCKDVQQKCVYEH